MIPTEYSQNNTLMSMSYWKTVEDLEAFARRPVHIDGLKFLAYQITKSDKPHDLGVLVCYLSYGPYIIIISCLA